MQLVIHIQGTRPMLQHNGRLANPLDQYTRAIKAISGKRQKSDDDLAKMLHIEARGGCWETADGILGIPNAAVWRCIFDAAKAYKRGEDIKRALSFEDVTVPVTVGGVAGILCDDFVADLNNIDYRAVKIQRAKTMRARPILREWSSTHTLELMEEVIDLDQLAPIFDRAGRMGGIGDWRPTYGTFTATVESN